MTTSSDPRPVCRVYAQSGDRHDVSVPSHGRNVPPERSPTIADRVSVTAIMTREPVCARPDLRLGALARLMIDHHIGCVPIVDERGRPHGIVTKFDLVEQLEPEMRNLAATATAGDVMMPLAITLDEYATVAHAASMMALEDLHHVMIVGRGGALIGVVSSKDIVRWLVENDKLAGCAEPPPRATSPWRPLDE